MSEPIKPRRLYTKLRASAPSLRTLPEISNPMAAAKAVSKLIGDRAYEVFVVLYLDARNRVFAWEELTEGNLTGVTVVTSSLIRNALLAGAVAIITVHQHPSGNLQPSPEDNLLWEKIRIQARLMDITVHDNLIVTREGFFAETERETMYW